MRNTPIRFSDIHAGDKLEIMPQYNLAVTLEVTGFFTLEDGVYISTVNQGSERRIIAKDEHGDYCVLSQIMSLSANHYNMSLLPYYNKSVCYSLADIVKKPFIVTLEKHS